MKKDKNKPFNPDAFESIITVEELCSKFDSLLAHDYTKVSLAKSIIALNYEIISSDYVDMKYSDIKDYYHFEVDQIV